MYKNKKNELPTYEEFIYRYFIHKNKKKAWVQNTSPYVTNFLVSHVYVTS